MTKSDDVGSPAARAHVEGYMVLAINKTPVNWLKNQVCSIVNSAAPEGHCGRTTHNIDHGSNVKEISVFQAGENKSPGEYTYG